MPGRTSLMVSPETRTSARVVASAVTTVPFWMRVVMVGSAVRLRRVGRPGGLPHKNVSCAHPLCPGLGGAARIHLLHGDALLHRADQPAEITADALLFVHTRHARRLHQRRIELGYGRDGDGCGVEEE